MKILRTPHERTTTLRRHEGMRGSSRGSFLLGLEILLVCHSFERPSRAADAPLVADAKTPVVTAEPVTTSSSLPSSDSVEWSVVGAAGPVIVGLASPSAGIWPPAIGLTSTAWQVDLQRRRPNERFVAGVTLEGTYDHAGGGAGQQLLGVDAFIGNDWHHRHWSLEATIGAGVEAAQIYYEDNYGAFSYHVSYELGLYAQGTLAAAVPVSNDVDILLRLGVHVTAAHDEDWFAASTIGLRYRLP
jgi:hypothetical protein